MDNSLYNFKAVYGKDFYAKAFSIYNDSLIFGYFDDVKTLENYFSGLLQRPDYTSGQQIAKVISKEELIRDLADEITRDPSYKGSIAYSYLTKDYSDEINQYMKQRNNTDTVEKGFYALFYTNDTNELVFATDRKDICDSYRLSSALYYDEGKLREEKVSRDKFIDALSAAVANGTGCKSKKNFANGLFEPYGTEIAERIKDKGFIPKDPAKGELMENIRKVHDYEEAHDIAPADRSTGVDHCTGMIYIRDDIDHNHFAERLEEAKKAEAMDKEPKKKHKHRGR